jgi:methanogenic corrinoid protein MtbC1
MQRRPYLIDCKLATGWSVVASPDPRLPTDTVSEFAYEVIQRLSRRNAARARTRPDPVAVADALLAADDRAAMELIEPYFSKTADLKSLYLETLAEAARELGRRWDRDEQHSVRVTIATGRIFAIMRDLVARFSPKDVSGTRHVVLATVPGEQHSLGLTMAADLLRQDGWLVDLKSGSSSADLLGELSQIDFALIGLSAASLNQLETLRGLVSEIRSLSPTVRVLVSGRLANICPELAERVGADVAAGTFEEAHAALHALNGLPMPGMVEPLT